MPDRYDNIQRSILMPSLGWSPRRVGLVELANCVALLTSVALA